MTLDSLANEILAIQKEISQLACNQDNLDLLDDGLIEKTFEAIGNSLNLVTISLYKKGIQIAENYEEESSRLNNQGIIVHYRPRVRYRPERNSLTFEWLRYELYRSNGKLRAKGKTIPKGSRENYPLTLFSKASSEEKELIRETESKLSQIRSAQKSVTSARKSLQWASLIFNNDFKMPALPELE